MACPTCNHMLEGIGHREFHRFWYCHRCGTLVEESRSSHGAAEWVILSISPPKLVDRCREFAEKMNLGPLSNSIAVDEWRRLGIAESITPNSNVTPPGEQPTYTGPDLA
jgi:hypothetical protein